ncbi:MAG: TadE family protein [Lachnospiraceae bacterium]
MDKRKKVWKGYLTVEASLIMPLLISAIIFTLYLGFYLYNVCILHQVAYTAALRGSLVKEGSNAQIEEFTDGQLKELVEDRLLAVKTMESRVQVSWNKVRVGVSISVYMPFGEWISHKVGLWTFETQAEAKRLEPVNIIRSMRTVGGK